MKKIVLFFVINAFLVIHSDGQIRGYLSEDIDSMEINAIDSALSNCLDNFKTNMDWENCITTYRKMWDDELDKTYHKLLKEMDTTLQKSLIASQFTWKMDLDNDEKMWMDIYSKYKLYYGREAYFDVMQYFLDRTRERALDLKFFLKGIQESKY
jgi:uncharacterized protein YecT (DUF1311 family)